MTTPGSSDSLYHPVSSNGWQEDNGPVTLLTVRGGSSHKRRTTAYNTSTANRSAEPLSSEAYKTSPFTTAVHMRKNTMWNEKPLTRRTTSLKSETRVTHHTSERRRALRDDACPRHPVPLAIQVDGDSPSPVQPLAWLHHPTAQPMVARQLQHLMDELYRQDPHAANRLSNARTQEEFLSAVCGLFNLSRALSFDQHTPPNPRTLAERMTHYLNRTLHTGPTLKTLAQFLGYSEKYCSDLFRATMGESFSRYLKRCRTERATTLLTTTDKSIAEIAFTLGFSDPFTFCHFFKRATGQSPRVFRTTQTRPYSHHSPCSPHKRFSPFS